MPSRGSAWPLPSPLRGGWPEGPGGGGTGSARFWATPTPTLRVDPPRKGEGWARFIVALLLILLSFSALAQTLPALTGRVVDNAGLVDPVAETALVQKLEAFEQKS